MIFSTHSDLILPVLYHPLGKFSSCRFNKNTVFQPSQLSQEFFALDNTIKEI